MDRFAPPEDPIELYKYDHIDERRTLQYSVGLVRTWLQNPERQENRWYWKRLKQLELLVILAAIVAVFFQIEATNEARQQFGEEMRFNREQWEEQRVSNAWALVAAATDPRDIGNIGAGFALATLNDKRELLTDIRLPGANLNGVRLTHAKLDRADFEGASLLMAEFANAHLAGANLAGSDLERANFGGANLKLANLENGYLLGANLESADLADANLASATLIKASLKNAVLRGANLQGADLLEADLAGADLYSADIEGAILERANIAGVTGFHCGALKMASFWESAYRDDGLACGAPIPEKRAAEAVTEGH